MKFEGRLWIHGNDCQLYPSIDVASLNASGALLRNAIERCLQLVDQMLVSVSRLQRDTSIPIDGLISKVEPTSGFTRPNTRIPSHWLPGSMKRLSLTRRPMLEVESSLTAETPDLALSDCLLKQENAVGLASVSKNHSAPETERRAVLFGPQKSDDDLRASGQAIALACTNDIGKLTNCKTLSRWICRISLAADEDSVSILKYILVFR